MCIYDLRSWKVPGGADVHGDEDAAVEHDKEDICRCCGELSKRVPEVASDDDVMWKPDVRETFEEVANRGLKFMNWLWTPSEKAIAIVCRDRFLQYTLEALTNDCQHTLRSEVVAQ
ncbi:Phosphoglycerate mutase-like protein 1 [Linum perenne]